MILCKESQKKIMSCDCFLCAYGDKERTSKDGVCDCLFPNKVNTENTINIARDYGKRKGGNGVRH